MNFSWLRAPIITKSSTPPKQAPLCALHAGLDHIQALQAGGVWLGKLITFQTAICQWQEAQVALGICVRLDRGVL